MNKVLHEGQKMVNETELEYYIGMFLLRLRNFLWKYENKRIQFQIGFDPGLYF